MSEVAGIGLDEVDLYLAETIEKYYYDPLGFVRWCYPWGEEGTVLADPPWNDLEEWQEEFLRDLGEESYEAAVTGRAVQMAAASGHGVGKSALVAWVVQWFMSTRPNPEIVVTANTKEQLTSKTWRELKKWQELAINGHLFEYHKTSYALKGAEDTWVARAVPWSEHNSDAFQGTHEKHVLVIFDEASAIPDIIWEVASGAMSTPGAMQVNFGNPTKNVGRFRECWRRFAHRWRTYEIDARDVKITNKQRIKEEIEDNGLDSDYVRIRWLGKFPERSSTQLISTSLVEAAQRREYKELDIPVGTPLVAGIDLARKGGDRNVVRLRRGPKLLRKKLSFREGDSMKAATRISLFLQEEQPDVIYGDAIGVGGPILDRLRQLGHDDIIDVEVGMPAEEPKRWFNKRMEIWQRMLRWLEFADIPAEDQALAEDLLGPEYLYDAKERPQLESKDDIRDRIGRSPDDGDAVALTFTHPNPIKRGDEEAHAEPEAV
jgi:hypothetical protein